MTVKSPPEHPQPHPAEHWKDEYFKKVFQIKSVTSLLNRYGSSIELENLYGAFLLTMMGQFVISDACYYVPSTISDVMTPALVYGRRKNDKLPNLEIDSDFFRDISSNRLPRTLTSLPPEVVNKESILSLLATYHVVAPLFLQEKLVGILFLGKKISAEAYTQTDLEVLFALCSVSAATFSNALLYENAKHSAREIQRLYDIRSEVISRITHEFRTPLTVIRGGIEMLAADEKYKNICEIFTDSQIRLEDLINSLLSLSDSSSGSDTTTVLLDPIKILHEIVHKYSRSSTSNKIQFVLKQTSGGPHPGLRISDNDLRVILNALVENAVKFSPEGSLIGIEIGKSFEKPQIGKDGLQLPEWRRQTEKSIEEYDVSLPRDHLTSTPTAQKRNDLDTVSKHANPLEYLVIRISDNGIGIPETDIPVVAEPFRQASNSPDVGIKGTGLGLALVHKTVTKYGGYLCCKSEEDVGTTFSVFLPAETSASY